MIKYGQLTLQRKEGRKKGREGGREGGKREGKERVSLKDVSIHTNRELGDQLLSMVKEMLNKNCFFI